MERTRIETLAEAARMPFLGPPATVAGDDPVLHYPLAIGEAAATVHALCADAALALGARDGRLQPAASLDVESAAASMASASIQLLEGTPLNEQQWERAERPGLLRPWGSASVLRGENAANPLVNIYQGNDGRWIHIHGGAQHLGDRIVEVLECERTRESVSSAIAAWDSFELEEALAMAETCGAVCRTPQEWAAHPQGQAAGKLATVETRQTLDSPPISRGPGAAPLAGVRVLDLGDGLAGPTCGQTLARFGADVLQVVAPDRVFIEPFVLDTGHGKRSAPLDLKSPAGAARFGDLLAESDVLCQSFRAGVLESLGFSEEVRQELNPGLVTVSINCYGPTGPWSDRRGWEGLGQAASGLALLSSRDGRPRLAPVTMCDKLTGFLAAAGAMRALVNRQTSGGSWDVRASLCQTAMWLTTMAAPVDEDSVPVIPDLEHLLVAMDVPIGKLWQFPPVVSVEGLGRSWPGPPARPGSDNAAWLPR